MLRKLLLTLFLTLCSVAGASIGTTNAQAAACTWTGGTGNWDSINTTSWDCGHVPTAGDTVVFGAGSCAGACTITVCGASAATCPNGVGVVGPVTSITAGACTNACVIDFAANGPIAVSAGTYSWTGTGTREFKWGTAGSTAATFTGTGTTGTIWDNSIITAETFTGTPNVIFDATATAGRSFASGAAKGYNNITITNPALGTNGNTFSVDFSPGGSSFSAVNITLTNAQYVYLAGVGTTTTISGTLTMNCSITVQCLLVTKGGGTSTLALTGSAQTLSYVFIQGITATTNGITVNNGFNGGRNSNVTVNVPSSSTSGFIIGGG